MHSDRGLCGGRRLGEGNAEVEERQWVRRKKYDTRVERWEEIATPLNDPLCFFMLVGHFRGVTPPCAIKRKRRAVYANRNIFGSTFLRAYDKFMLLCFQTYVGVATDAQIRASVALQRAEAPHGTTAGQGCGGRA